MILSLRESIAKDRDETNRRFNEVNKRFDETITSLDLKTSDLQRDMAKVMSEMTNRHVDNSQQQPPQREQETRKRVRGGPRYRCFDHDSEEPPPKEPKRADIDMPGPSEPVSLKGYTVDRCTTLQVRVETALICNDWKLKQRSGLQDLAFGAIEETKRVPVTKSHKENWISDAFEGSKDGVLSHGSVDWNIHDNIFKDRRLQEVGNLLYHLSRTNILHQWKKMLKYYLRRYLTLVTKATNPVANSKLISDSKSK